MVTPYRPTLAKCIVGIGILIGLAACAQEANTSLTVLIPRTSSSYPSLSFPDIPPYEAPVVRWNSLSDTAMTAVFSIREQQLAILTPPNSSASAILLLTPKHPITASFRTSPPTVLSTYESTDFQRYLSMMQRLSNLYSPYDTLQNSALANSMHTATLQYIYSHPLSKGVLIALQAVGPDSAKLLPIENHLPLYAFLDSLLISTYNHSLLLESLSQAVNDYQHFIAISAPQDSSAAPSHDYSLLNSCYPQSPFPFRSKMQIPPAINKSTPQP